MDKENNCTTDKALQRSKWLVCISALLPVAGTVYVMASAGYVTPANADDHSRMITMTIIMGLLYIASDLCFWAGGYEMRKSDNTHANKAGKFIIYSAIVTLLACCTNYLMPLMTPMSYIIASTVCNVTRTALTVIAINALSQISSNLRRHVRNLYILYLIVFVLIVTSNFIGTKYLIVIFTTLINSMLIPGWWRLIESASREAKDCQNE